ncbi:hypothetical protein PENTCL1PPCAC_14191, partial [Pristionchus entomophagus]
LFSTMKHPLESTFLTLHSISSVLAITLSLLLVYVSFRHTPKRFATYGIMMKFNALVDVYVAIGSSVCLQRIIAIDWALIIISYGPCEYIGPSTCFAATVTLLGGSTCFIYTVAASFVYRLMIALWVARDDDIAVRDLMNRKHTDYGADALEINQRCSVPTRFIVGFLDIRSVTSLTYLLILVVFFFPIYAIILCLR